MKKLLIVSTVLALLFAGGTSGLATERTKLDLQCREQIAVIMVHSVAAGLGEIIKSISTEKERIELIRMFIAPIRFYVDNSGYFYVYDLNCVNLAHATQPELQGKNLYDYQDIKGKYVIQKLAEKAQERGGFVEYYWQNPQTKKEQKKIGYVEIIPGTNYFIGTGVYLK